MNKFPDLRWAPYVDPEKVYRVLVDCVGVPDTIERRRSFYECWPEQDWTELLLEGAAICGVVKLRRGERVDVSNAFVANLYVSCYHEVGNSDLAQVLRETNDKLLEVLVSAGLRKKSSYVFV